MGTWKSTTHYQMSGTDKPYPFMPRRQGYCLFFVTSEMYSADRVLGVRPQLTFLFIVSHECRAYEIVKSELNKLILCDMSAFEQEYSQVCL